jgi:hypothetical protein
VFTETPGVQPNPPLYGQPLAEEVFGPSAIPAGTETQSTRPVAKEGEGAAAGITAATGVYSYDLEDGDEERAPLPGEPGSPLQPVTEGSGGRFMTVDEARQLGRDAVAKEMAAFRRFERARRKAGAWRDFEFRAVERVCGHNLNDAGRLAVRKAVGEVAVAGLAVVAADTGRVLMLQRALEPDGEPPASD